MVNSGFRTNEARFRSVAGCGACDCAYAGCGIITLRPFRRQIQLVDGLGANMLARSVERDRGESRHCFEVFEDCVGGNGGQGGRVPLRLLIFVDQCCTNSLIEFLSHLQDHM